MNRYDYLAIGFEHKHFEVFGQVVCDAPKTVISREYCFDYIWK